jgi:hypothetical protein
LEELMKRIMDRYVGVILPVFWAGLFTLSVCFAAGCSRSESELNTFDNKPRLRKGQYFGSVIPPNYLDADELGVHNISEKNGFVYCSKGGFIDTDHLRKSADWTKCLADKAYDHIMNGDREFIFKLREPSRYYVKLEYPACWQELDERCREDIARDVSIDLGQYFAHTACVWHEILTWFGYTWTEIGSEYMSAFSWDDIYSNLLGSRIGAAAMRNVEYEFNLAVTAELEYELQRLNVQPSAVGRKAKKEIHGDWYTGGYYFFLDTKKRHLDVGLDGYVSPWIVPGICDEKTVVSYRVPDVRFVEKYGFSIELEIEPRERIRGKIFDVIYADGGGKRLKPEVHFGPIMNHISREAEDRYGFDVSLPR